MTARRKRLSGDCHAVDAVQCSPQSADIEDMIAAVVWLAHGTGAVAWSPPRQ